MAARGSSAPAGSQCNGGGPDQRSVLLVSEAHGQQLIRVLRSFRERRALFDFSIRLRDEALPCHRCVLAACSDFFRVMFELDTRERDDGVVTLTHLSPQAVHTFLDFAYSGEIEIREDNVELLFQLASFLQVGFLLQACSDFLIQMLDISNCVQLLALAEAYGSSILLSRTSDFIIHNFHELSSGLEFLEVPERILERCLASDGLQVPDEKSVLDSLLRWTRHEPETRADLISMLLSRIRLHHIPTGALEEFGRSQILNTEECKCMIRDALVQSQKFRGLFSDARTSTTNCYIYVQKTEESGERLAFYYNVNTDRWTTQDDSQLYDLPGSVIVSFGEKLFVIGGCRGECRRLIRNHIATSQHDATDEVWCYCPVARSFTIAPRMHFARSMHACVSVLRRIYAIGGKTRDHCVVDVEYLDPLSDAWTTVSPLPKGIYFPEASSSGNVIYTLGSEVETSEAFNPLLDCFFRYDTVTDQWCQLVAEFGQFFHATLVKSVSINDTLFLCDLSTYKVHSFCAESSVWSGEGSFECAGFNASAVAVRDRIFILGGDFSPDEISDEVQVYDRRRSEWREVSPMPRPLTEFHCQVLSFSRHSDPWRTEDDTALQPEL